MLWLIVAGGWRRDSFVHISGFSSISANAITATLSRKVQQVQRGHRPDLAKNSGSVLSWPGILHISPKITPDLLGLSGATRLECGDVGYRHFLAG